MNRREIMGGLGLATFGFAGLQSLGAQDLHHQQDPQKKDQDRKPQDAGMSGHKGHTAAAKTISDCTVSCECTARHCVTLVAEGKKEHLTTHSLVADCATICATTAALVARGSSLAGTQLEGCAKACDTTASECEKHDDAMMKECAQTCRSTATLCREHAGKPRK